MVTMIHVRVKYHAAANEPVKRFLRLSHHCVFMF